MKLVDSHATGMEFEFDQVLLMPTAEGYRALVEQARVEIKPRIMKYLSGRWSDGAIENLSFFAMAVAVMLEASPIRHSRLMWEMCCSKRWASAIPGALIEKRRAEDAGWP